MAAEVLVAEDDPLLRTLMVERLRGRGDVVLAAGSLEEARALLRRTRPDAAVVATMLPDGPGSALLRELAADHPVPCVMVAPCGAVGPALDAVRRGAADYLEKPFPPERLETTLDAALERGRLRQEIRVLRARLQEEPDPERLVGLRDALDRVERIAPAADAPVLLVGEPGTGKRTLARFLHRVSPRRRRSFLPFHAPAGNEDEVAAALFGRDGPRDRAGTRTGPGLVERADGGTLYLDRIAALPAPVQDRLLHLLDTGRFRRVGGTADRGVHVRILASCTRPPGLEVADGRLREELHERLGLLRVDLRPLRDRPADLPVLADAFLHRFAAELGRPVRRFRSDALARLQEHAWPGNVRELRNVVEGAVLRSRGEEITPELLPEGLRRRGPYRVPEGVRLGSAGLDLEELERGLVLEALRRTQGNRTEAGRLLGLSRHQIRNRLKKYGVER